MKPSTPSCWRPRLGGVGGTGASMRRLALGSAYRRDDRRPRTPTPASLELGVERRPGHEDGAQRHRHDDDIAEETDADAGGQPQRHDGEPETRRQREHHRWRTPEQQPIARLMRTPQVPDADAHAPLDADRRTPDRPQLATDP